MFTRFLNQHRAAFVRGLVISAIVLLVALILTVYFAGFIFLAPLVILTPPLFLLLTLVLLALAVMVGALLWVKLEQAFETVKPSFTPEPKITPSFKSELQVTKTKEKNDPLLINSKPSSTVFNEWKQAKSNPLPPTHITEETHVFFTANRHRVKASLTRCVEKTAHHHPNPTDSSNQCVL